ncbi:two-component system, OmpR family, sensor histidine kinase PrrB [Actinacidiphila alni]|uniref:histidine kinase n=1 Tax=Actinacidiphila alni TaxID=380248 RepID=A0A1I1XYG4_9ACTN|nr:HAMP domain-containing sensor histidine kinase [Actinacidiphila alni]SFE10833.1 two-component system, OmpR family, sensor histidine kinase PrrB [Actinacidiphila alni]
MRLSTRIALAVTVLVPLLVLASGWIMVRLVGHDVHAQADAHLRQRAAAVRPDARNLLRAMANDRSAAVEQAKQRKLFAAALDVGIRVTGTEGTVTEGPQPALDRPLPAPADAGHPVTFRADGASWRVLAVPIGVVKPAAKGTLWLFSPDTAGQEQISRVRRRIVTVALLTASVAGAAAWLAVTRAALPLRRLQRRASGIDPRVSSARLDHTPTGVTEVDELAHSLRTVLARYDEQAARTEEALATARSFSAAASHELRNPLMSMRINLDVLDGGPEPGATERAEIVADLRAEHTRLLGLLVMLRALAQGDLVEADAFVPVDLADLLHAAVADLRREHPHVRVALHAPPGLRVHGWPQGLRSAVDNLLLNAAVHGAGGARDGTGGAGAESGGTRAGVGGQYGDTALIEVTLAPGTDPAAPAAVLTVDDHGPGVPPAARQEIFQRFRRRPDSPGSGLGLALVGQQIALHGGRITAGDRPGGPGARFTVVLPLRPAGDPLPGGRDWLAGASAGEPR